MEVASRLQPIGSAANAAPTAMGALLAASALFAIRRLAGAFESALPASTLLVTTACMAAIIWTCRTVWLQFHVANGRPSDGTRQTWLVTWSPVLSIFLAMVAFSWPMARLVDWLFWLPMFVGEAVFVKGAHRNTTVQSFLHALPRDGSAESPDEPTDAILQQFTRLRDKTTGNEVLLGTLLAEFSSRQRVAVLHVAFCPPLESAPDVHAEHADGPNATVRVTDVLPHGARLEVRLAQASNEPTHVTVDFAANSGVASPTRKL